MWSVQGSRTDYEAALVAGTRTERFRADLYDRNFQPLGTPLTLANEGGVTTELRGEPQSRASFALIDEKRVLPDVDSGKWHAWNIRLAVETLVGGSWIEVPLFFGPVQDVAQKGIRFELDCDSKDVQHIEPHTFARSTVFREHTKLHQAIKQGLEARGDTRVALDHTRHRLHTARGGGVGTAPMKLFRSFARDADMQLFLRGDGTWRLRDWPSSAAWRYKATQDGTLIDWPEERSSVGPVRDTIVVKGRRTERVEVTKKTEMDEKALAAATSIHIVNDQKFIDLLDAGQKIKIGGQGDNEPETRTIAGSYTPGSRNIPLSNALSNAHNKGAPVTITVKKDVERAVIGRATLTQNHRFSAETLTGGKRPRIEVFERPSIHKVSRATDVAESLRDRIAGQSEQSIAISTVPIWHLEVGDIYIVDWRAVDHRSRVQSIFYPLELGAAMQMNWLGEHPPKGKR